MSHIADYAGDVGYARACIGVDNTVKMKFAAHPDAAHNIQIIVHFNDAVLPIYRASVMGDEKNISIAVCRHIVRTRDSQPHKALDARVWVAAFHVLVSPLVTPQQRAVGAFGSYDIDKAGQREGLVPVQIV